MPRYVKISDVGLKQWLDENTELGYDEFVHLYTIGVRPGNIARIFNKQTRTIHSWIDEYKAEQASKV